MKMSGSWAAVLPSMPPVVARSWSALMQANTATSIPSDTRIGREHYTPPIEAFINRYDVEYLGYFAVARKPNAIEMLDYMIVSGQDYERYVSRPADYPAEAEAYNEFFARNELVKEFVPDRRTLGGPTIRIYKVSR